MDKPGKWNPAFAALAGLLVFIGYSLFPVPALTPELSEEAAVAAGLRPAADIFPGLWRYLAALLPPSASWYGLAGRLAAGVFAALFYTALRWGVVMLLRSEKGSRRWSRLLAPALALLATAMASFADPVWRAFSLFSPTALFLVFLTLEAVLFAGWVVRAGWWRMCTMLFAAGLFAAETPLALVVPVGFFVCHLLIGAAIRDHAFVPREDFPTLAELPVWRLFFSGTAGLLLGGGAIIRYAVAHDTLGANGWGISTILFRYAQHYVLLATGAATWMGWVLALGLAVMPFFIVLKLFPILTNDDRPIPFHFGLIMLFCGIAAYFEQGPLRGAWFWTWLGHDEPVKSATLLALLSVLSSASVLFAGGAFVFDAYNKKRCEHRTPGVNAVYRVAVGVMFALLAALVLPQVPHARVRRILAFNQTAVEETVRELNGAKRLFTDGSADAALELAALRRGVELVTVDLMGTSSTRDIALRTRGLEGEADVNAARMGASVLLRVWACDKQGGLDESALQLGLELWKREQQLTPPVASAFLARTRGMAEADIKDAGAIARRFAERIAALADDANSQDVSPSVRNEFFTISWRLSRMARYRHDLELAENLDEGNSILKRMLRNLEYERLRVFMQMTPSEGLELALKRADFIEAARYASAVLKLNPADASANFGLGMYFLVGKNLPEAEKYLRRVLEKRPDEPVVLNNLSIICRKTRRYDESLQLAKRALEILPDKEEIKQTYADAVKRAP